MFIDAVPVPPAVVTVIVYAVELTELEGLPLMTQVELSMLIPAGRAGLELHAVMTPLARFSVGLNDVIA